MRPTNDIQDTHPAHNGTTFQRSSAAKVALRQTTQSANVRRGCYRLGIFPGCLAVFPGCVEPTWCFTHFLGVFHYRGPCHACSGGLWLRLAVLRSVLALCLTGGGVSRGHCASDWRRVLAYQRRQADGVARASGVLHTGCQRYLPVCSTPVGCCVLRCVLSVAV
jgi:hypothetical protein